MQEDILVCDHNIICLLVCASEVLGKSKGDQRVFYGEEKSRKRDLYALL